MDVKLIALDIDGTLTDDNKDIMPKTLEVLLKLQDKGIRLAIASARTTRGIMRYCKMLHLPEHNGILMTYSGGMLTDAVTGRMQFSHPLDEEETRELLKCMHNLEISTMLDDGEKFYVLSKDGYLLDQVCRDNEMSYEVVDDLSKFEGYVPMKLNIAVRKELARDMKEKIASFLPEDMIIYRTEPTFMEIIPEGSTKGDGIRQLSRIYNIPLENIVAFGDSESDTTMLRAVGMGVAMGNAPEKVKEEADLVTTSNNEEGIAKALETICGEM